MREKLLKWLGVSDHEGRIKDLERHFVVKRDEQGKPTKTLADVPLADRKELEPNRAGLSWQQRKAMLEFQERKLS